MHTFHVPCSQQPHVAKATSLLSRQHRYSLSRPENPQKLLPTPPSKGEEPGCSSASDRDRRGVLPVSPVSAHSQALQIASPSAAVYTRLVDLTKRADPSRGKTSQGEVVGKLNTTEHTKARAKLQAPFTEDSALSCHLHSTM